MALKPTIYKLAIAVNDLDRSYYDNVSTTVALHPSETLERMMVRVLAFCLNAQERLVFCGGLSESKEPDLWAHSLDGNIELWVEVGEPAEERIRKISHLGDKVKIYSFNSKSIRWWDMTRRKLTSIKASVYQFEWAQIQNLAALVERTMDMSITISDQSIYVATKQGECEVTLNLLQES